MASPGTHPRGQCDQALSLPHVVKRIKSNYSISWTSQVNFKILLLIWFPLPGMFLSLPHLILLKSSPSFLSLLIFLPHPFPTDEPCKPILPISGHANASGWTQSYSYTCLNPTEGPRKVTLTTLLIPRARTLPSPTKTFNKD